MVLFAPNPPACIYDFQLQPLGLLESALAPVYRRQVGDANQGVAVLWAHGTLADVHSFQLQRFSFLPLAGKSVLGRWMPDRPD